MQLSVLPDPKTGTPTIFLPRLANIHALCNEETQHQGEEGKAAGVPTMLSFTTSN